MKRRIACMIMALVLVIGLLPMGVIHTNAASYLYPSENVVNLIKQFEGFSASAYWDVNQWTAGYGTPAYAGQYMSETEADAALRAKLSEISMKINQFTAAYNLNLTQNRHDALVSFSFNCGTDWMSQPGRFLNAVVSNADVNTFLFAISLWANVSTVPDANLLNRRMSEANLYLNGVYSKSAPAAYTYTIFDPNGGVAGNNGEDKMQGYQSGSNVNILVGNPTKAGTAFGGWFTSPTGGTGVKYLNSTTAGRTLYAQYGIPATITGTYANVRNGAGTNYTQVGTINGNSQIVIVETAQVNNAMWGRFVDGWISLEYTNYNGTNIPVINNGASAATGAINTGTVVCNSGVNVRSGPGTNYTTVGSAVNGQYVTIYEIKPVNGVNWGRIGDNRWICLTYVKLNNNITTTTGTTSGSGVIWVDGGINSTTTGTTITTPTTTNYTLGTVNTNGLRVRTAAGVSNPIVTTLNQGAQVKVYNQVIKDNAPWGQIDGGWVCMNYVTLTNSAVVNPVNPTNPTGAAIATGTVKSGAALNVRSAPGTASPLVSRLNPGTVVNVYEKTNVNGMDWGRIGTNQWVCLAYVNLNTTTVIPGTTGTTVITGTTVSPNTTVVGTTATTGTGTVISTTGLNVRSGAGGNFAKVSSLPSGSTVTVYEVVTNGNQQWGRIGTNQWVCMTYVRMNNAAVIPGTTTTTTTTTTIPSTGYNGTVISNSPLNVRAAAGTNNAIVGKLTKGTQTTIYEVTSVNGVNWGRTATGWVCMTYVQLNGNAVISSGVVWQN